MTKLSGLLGKREASGDVSDALPHEFPELDLDKIKSSLKLVKEGRARGEKNLPPTASEAMDDIEHKIISTVETEQRRQLQELNNLLKSYHQSIAKLDLEHEAINISAAAQRASTEFVVKVDEGKAKLFTLWRNVCMIENQWNGFRKKHNLIYPADYPISRLLNIAVILVILAIESILNGTFLARGLETGLLGGIVEAAVIAAANVAFGFFMGDSVLRYLFHRNIMLRVLALFEVTASCLIDIMFNLMVGHYRDALGGADPEHASNEAFANFMAAPFTLAAAESWLLFGMGMVFFAIAAIDGFKIDDPYPGYGKISRKHEEIVQEYTDEKAGIVDDLAHTRDQALDYMNEARQSLAERRNELSTILTHREKLLNVFEAHQDYITQSANDLLATYRNANAEARTTPAPAHFNSVYTLPKALTMASLSYAINEELLNVNINKTDEALLKAISRVNGQMEGAVKEFHQVNELSSGNEHAVH